jgi:hypothetical protein
MVADPATKISSLSITSADSWKLKFAAFAITDGDYFRAMT